MAKFDVKDVLQEAWGKTLTNLRRYSDEIRLFSHELRTDHLPRFKNGLVDPFGKDNYPHLVRNLFTEAFRAMPRTLSGLFLIWLGVKLLQFIF